VTELVSQAGRVLCGGNRGFAAKPCLGRWHISAESLAKKLSARRDSPELREKTAYSAGYLMKRGREFNPAWTTILPSLQFSDVPENRSKFARVRAISYQRMDRREAPAALNAGIRQDLPAVDFC
jgi:hypothetical protein